MQATLRSCSRLVKGLLLWMPPACGPVGTASEGTLLRSPNKPFWNTTFRWCHSEQLKDYAVPNSRWNQDMMTQYEKFMELTKDGQWEKIKSHRHLDDDIAEATKQEHQIQTNKGSRQFIRNIDSEGLGFEYVIFFNVSEKRAVCLFQPGPYLEGLTGYAHGGAVATIIYQTFGTCVMAAVGFAFTLNITVNYKRPISLDSVVLVDCKVSKIEGRKVHVTGQVNSLDGQIIHVEATGFYIQLKSKNSSL